MQKFSDVRIAVKNNVKHKHINIRVMELCNRKLPIGKHAVPVGCLPSIPANMQPCRSSLINFPLILHRHLTKLLVDSIDSSISLFTAFCAFSSSNANCQFIYFIGQTLYLSIIITDTNIPLHTVL